RLSQIVQRYMTTFSHVVVVPNVFGMSSVGLSTRDIGGVVALYNKQNLTLPHSRALKHILDAILLIPFGLIGLPIVFVCALAVFLVDRRNPFYRQKREGFGGKPVHIVKLRTMHLNADELLER